MLFSRTVVLEGVGFLPGKDIRTDRIPREYNWNVLATS